MDKYCNTQINRKELTNYMTNINQHYNQSIENKSKNDVLIRCMTCKTIFHYNDSNIPQGATYEAKCENCGTYIKRKKL